MVPFYQIAVDLLIASCLLQTVLYAPVLLDRSLPRWINVSVVTVSAILLAGVIHAVIVGHWPFRG